MVPGAVRAGALASFEGIVVGGVAAFGEAADVVDLAVAFRRARTGSRLGVEGDGAVLRDGACASATSCRLLWPRVTKGYELAIDFRANTSVAKLRVDLVGEVERRASDRKRLDFASWSDNKHVVINAVRLQKPVSELFSVRRIALFCNRKRGGDQVWPQLCKSYNVSTFGL